MKTTAKYDIGQTVWFDDNGCTTSAKIEATDYAAGIGVVHLIRLTIAGNTAFCIRAESELFQSLEDLLGSMKN